MKKKILIVCGILLSSGFAFAKTIDFDTQVKWNSYVVEAALEQAGLIGSYRAYEDVRVTHDRILAELLKKESFSIRTATTVCLNKCNMSDFLKNGRGQSGKKCPELCTSFADALVAVNNEFTEKGGISVDELGSQIRQPDGAIKVYSEDKRFYALHWDGLYESTPTSIKKHSNLCKIPQRDYGTTDVQGVVFETQGNKPIVLMTCYCQEGECGCGSECGVGEYAHVSTDAISFYLFQSWGDLQFNNRYLHDYEYKEKLAIQIRKDLRDVPRIDESIIRKYFSEQKYKSAKNAIQEAEELVDKWDKFDGTKTSWEKYEELESFHLPIISDDVSYLNGIVKDYENLKKNNVKTIDWSKKVTYFPAEAYSDAIRDMTEMFPTIDKSKIKCSGDCLTGIKGIGRDDIVTCTIDDITIKYVFDDICQSLTEEWLSDPEYLSISEIQRAKQELQEYKESFNE